MKNLMISAIREDNILSASALSLVKGGATNAITCTINNCGSNYASCGTNNCQVNDGACGSNGCKINVDQPPTPPPFICSIEGCSSKGV